MCNFVLEFMKCMIVMGHSRWFPLGSLKAFLISILDLIGTGYIQHRNCFSNLLCNVHHHDHHRKCNNVQGILSIEALLVMVLYEYGYRVL